MSNVSRLKSKLKPNQFWVNSHLFTERPILFQTEMIRAILEDRKTQTRREIKLDIDELLYEVSSDTLESLYVFQTKDKERSVSKICPHGKRGDLLWARETFSKNLDLTFDYKTDFSFSRPQGGWKPSIHMPKAAARIWMMIEEVRPEKLWDISQADALSEGIEKRGLLNGQEYFRNYEVEQLITHSPFDSFMSLWISINGDDSWDANPWLWVIKYRVLSKTGRPSNECIWENFKQISNKEVVNG